MFSKESAAAKWLDERVEPTFPFVRMTTTIKIQISTMHLIDSSSNDLGGTETLRWLSVRLCKTSLSVRLFVCSLQISNGLFIIFSWISASLDIETNNTKFRPSLIVAVLHLPSYNILPRPSHICKRVRWFFPAIHIFLALAVFDRIEMHDIFQMQSCSKGRVKNKQHKMHAFDQR